MALHAGIPEKAIKAALRQFGQEEHLQNVTWDLTRNRPGRPTKVYFTAESAADLRAAKWHLEQFLNDSGFDLYP